MNENEEVEIFFDENYIKKEDWSILFKITWFKILV